ncbi:EAL domain-containing protein [Photobacterium japonica]|uniref:EAL domain-containing protein n=1 Tax=Photobacterium japonica TaxID=2910235 RepID=UPI003D0FD418
MALPISLLAAFFNLLAIFFASVGYGTLSLTLGYAGNMTAHMFPVLLNIYLATYYANQRRLPKAAAISCSLVAFFIISQQWGLIASEIMLPNNFALSLASAFVVCIIIHHLKKVRLLNLSSYNNVIDTSANMLVACMIALGALLVFCYFIELLFSQYISPYLTLPELDPTSFYDGLLYELIRGLFWSVGVNGHNVLHMFKTELYELSMANMADWRNFGTDLNIISTNFYDFFTGIGGSGNTLSLVLCMLFFAKSKGYQLLARTVLILTIFNINEPVLFGVPIIFNPIMILPFLAVPLVSFTLAYAAMAYGIIPPLSEVHSWITPPIISGYMGSGGSYAVAGFQVFLIGVGMLMYYPFFKMMDQRSTGIDLTDMFKNRFFTSSEIEVRTKLTSFIPSMQSNFEAQKEVEALQSNGSFLLYYQPQMDITTGKVVALEALVRHQSHNGKISPPTFLPSFNQLGLMPDLDFWVLEHAIADAELLSLAPDFCLSINVSSETVLTKGFVKSLKRVIDNSAFDYAQIEIEITEDLLIKEEQRTAAIINEIKQLGVSVALDDFGTGYSSLAYLSRFDFDKIKIDRSLVTALDTERGKSLFEVVVQLGQITQAKIVVEGVETEAELAFVNSRGIRYVQGYYFYRPMSVAQLMNAEIVCDSQNVLSSDADLR